MTSNQDRLLCGTTKWFQPLGLPFWLAGERWNKTKEIHRGNSRQNYHNLSLNWFAWPLQSHKKCSKNHPKNNPGCIFGPFWTNSPSFLPCFSPKNPNSQQPTAAQTPSGCNKACREDGSCCSEAHRKKVGTAILRHTWRWNFWKPGESMVNPWGNLWWNSWMIFPWKKTGCTSDSHTSKVGSCTASRKWMGSLQVKFGKMMVNCTTSPRIFTCICGQYMPI